MNDSMNDSVEIRDYNELAYAALNWDSHLLEFVDPKLAGSGYYDLCFQALSANRSKLQFRNVVREDALTGPQYDALRRLTLE